MNVALIDDDVEFNEIFRKEVNQFNLSYRYFSSYPEFKRELHAGYPVDILLLDIKMPDINGFEIAKELEKERPNINIIYMTDHSELIYDSFGSNISGFFPKIFLDHQADILIRKIYEAYNQNNYLSIKTGAEERRIRFANIAYIEKIKKRIILYTINNEEVLTRFAYLHELEAILPSSLFCYINRSVMINIKQVKSIQNPHLYLINTNRRFDISRGRYKEVRNAISLL